MRLFVVCVIVFGFLASANGQTFYGSTDLKVFRDGRDKELRDKVESPLKADDFDGFKGLNYYPVNRAFRVTATFERMPGEKYFEMPTSSGKTKKFVKYGVLRFKLNGKAFSLSVYQTDEETLARFPEYADLLFVPFKDKTSRADTYGGGRYIDIKRPKGGKVLLDFNLAYNPNCAYGNDKYNCPIPPKENTLDVAIKAGEKRFIYSGYEKTH